MTLFYLTYVFSILYISIPIFKLIIEDLINNNTLFLLLSNYILLFGLSILYGFYNSVFYSLIIAFILMIFAFLLIRDFKTLFGRYQLLSMPYYILTIYMFSYILVNLSY